MLMSRFAGWLQAKTGVGVRTIEQSLGAKRFAVQTSGASTKSWLVDSMQVSEDKPGTPVPPSRTDDGVLKAAMATVLLALAVVASGARADVV